MEESIRKLLVNASNSEEIEIARLSKFRGLDHIPTEKNIDDFLDRYFDKDTIPFVDIPVKKRNEKWASSFAGNTPQGHYINPLRLEPFVARYVRAINRIGAITDSSCDGWHLCSRNELYVRFLDRYSMLWHKKMCESLENKYGVIWHYDGLRAVLPLPKSDAGKIKKYIALNKVAESFEAKQKPMFDLKMRLVARAKNQKKATLSDDELDAYFDGLLKELA